VSESGDDSIVAKSGDTKDGGGYAPSWGVSTSPPPNTNWFYFPIKPIGLIAPSLQFAIIAKCSIAIANQIN